MIPSMASRNSGRQGVKWARWWGAKLPQHWKHTMNQNNQKASKNISRLTTKGWRKLVQEALQETVQRLTTGEVRCQCILGGTWNLQKRSSPTSAGVERVHVSTVFQHVQHLANSVRGATFHSARGVREALWCLLELMVRRKLFEGTAKVLRCRNPGVRIWHGISISPRVLETQMPINANHGQEVEWSRWQYMAIKFDGEHMLITFTYLDIDASRHRHEMTLASGRNRQKNNRSIHIPFWSILPSDCSAEMAKAGTLTTLLRTQ